MKFVPHVNSTFNSLMGDIVDRHDLKIIIIIRRYTHASSVEMKRALNDTGKLTNNLVQACEKVYAACKICVSTGSPRHMKKILSHM